jgi:PadR family transcriptional regulator AphA
MSLRHALLGLLAAQPQTGYGLLKHFQGSLNYVWPAQHSQIYPELARLAATGLIRVAGRGPRASKTYEVTPAGVVELRRWLAETTPQSGRSEAMLRVFFLWLLDTDDAEAYLAWEAATQRRLLDELERIRGSGEPTDRKQRAYRLAREAGIATTRARIDWAEWARHEVQRWDNERPGPGAAS